LPIEATKEKLTFGGSALFPKFSICDLTVIQQKDNCKMVVDAYTHVMEQYLTYPISYLQDRIAEDTTNLN
jgi:NADP-dependent alcohol dehydrogenase